MGCATAIRSTRTASSLLRPSHPPAPRSPPPSNQRRLGQLQRRLVRPIIHATPALCGRGRVGPPWAAQCPTSSTAHLRAGQRVPQLERLRLGQPQLERVLPALPGRRAPPRRRVWPFLPPGLGVRGHSGRIERPLLEQPQLERVPPALPGRRAAPRRRAWPSLPPGLDARGRPIRRRRGRLPRHSSEADQVAAGPPASSLPPCERRHEPPVRPLPECAARHPGSTYRTSWP